jgi:hypothetical protein
MGFDACMWRFVGDLLEMGLGMLSYPILSYDRRGVLDIIAFTI